MPIIVASEMFPFENVKNNYKKNHNDQVFEGKASGLILFFQMIDKEWGMNDFTRKYKVTVYSVH